MGSWGPVVLRSLALLGFLESVLVSNGQHLREREEMLMAVGIH